MKTYKKVYFRIKTPLYSNPNGVGFSNDQDGQTFNTEALNIFLNDGWCLKNDKYKSNNVCYRVTKDKQELHLHPQTFSGVIIEENIPYIEQLLSGNKVFEHYHTDIYEEVFDITDEEYLNILKSKKKEIESDILEAYKTKRSNLYITSRSPIEKVLNKYRIKRLTHHTGVYSSSNIDWQYITDVFEGLVNEQKIVIAKTRHGIGYRTDKKFLQKLEKVTA